MMLHAIALSLARDGKPDIIADAPWPQRFAALGFEPA
jgi:tRNA pseudouridine32 synthase/23S rRNA pseudouridine746 synthase